MKARYLHFADCHLGYRQYNNTERYNDFARAFLSVIDVAIAEGVDFVLLAGDLFQKRSIDALTLNQAMNGLERLHKEGIPCLAVEGNHERKYLDDTIGWMQFLAQRRLLILLDAEFKQGSPQLGPYDPHKRSGAYYEPLPGLRVYGLSYRGSATALTIEHYAKALADEPNGDVQFVAFMAHAGLEGVLADEAGGLSYRQWSVLQPYVNYLALGHVHKPFEVDDWIYNPGSTESCATVEAEWRDRGYYLVEVDSDAPQKHRAVRHANPRRPFHRFHIRADHAPSPDALYEQCETYLRRKAIDLGRSSGKRPVVELQISGVLPFDRSALELDRFEEMIETLFKPLLPLVKNYTRATQFDVSSDAGLSRPQLERQVLTNLLEDDSRYAEDADRWAALAITLKKLAITGAGPEAILAELPAPSDSTGANG